MFRSAYDGLQGEVSAKGAISEFGKTRTQQHHKKECDINTIVKNFGVNRPVPMTQKMPLSGDFSAAPDFMAAQNLLLQAKKAFLQVPANIRTKFDNNPAKYIEFAENPANLEQMREWGLAPKKEPEKFPVPSVVEPPKA